MVDGESKAALRSAVSDGLLEYRRTCDTADAAGVEVQHTITVSLHKMEIE